MIPPVQNNISGKEFGSDRAAFEKAIESFEGVFISEIVRGLRKAFSEELSEGGGGFGKGVYMTWFDQTLSEAIAKAGGLGLKDQLQDALPLSNDDNTKNHGNLPDFKGFKAYLDKKT